MDGIFQEGCSLSQGSGSLEYFDGDAGDLGNPDGIVGDCYYWEQSSCVIISDDESIGKIVAVLSSERIEFYGEQSIGWTRCLDTNNGSIYVDDVVVVGQRRNYLNQSFPQAGGQGPSPAPNPCFNAATAVPWNADAAAAASIDAFLQAALQLGYADAPNGVPHLGNREFGLGLYKGTGSQVLGNAPSYGGPVVPGQIPSVTIQYTGITNANYMGDVHTHPAGSVLPSAGDWAGFMANNRLARQYGRTSETFYMYIVAIGPDGSVLSIRVYEDGPRPVDSIDPPIPSRPGSEVNPNAQPC